jgi:hypothetical protein
MLEQLSLVLIRRSLGEIGQDNRVLGNFGGDSSGDTLHSRERVSRAGQVLCAFRFDDALPVFLMISEGQELHPFRSKEKGTNKKDDHELSGSPFLAEKVKHGSCIHIHQPLNKY